MRQRLHKLSKENDWRGKHNVLIGSRDIQGDYSELLSRSKYCLVAPGDGWSARAEDAILHGCVPVVIMDGVHVVYESILDWSSFSIRIPEADIDQTLEILLAIPEKKLKLLQTHLARVWNRCEMENLHSPFTSYATHARRFRFLNGPALAIETREKQRKNLEETDLQRQKERESVNKQYGDMTKAAAALAAGEEGSAHLEGLLKSKLPRAFRSVASVRLCRRDLTRFTMLLRGDPVVDDAFATIMQWLHSRIPHTR